MAIDLFSLTDYSWSDIAKAAKQAIVSAALGGTELMLPGGRTIQRITTEEAVALYNTACEMVAAETDGANGLGNILVRFGQEQ